MLKNLSKKYKDEYVFRIVTREKELQAYSKKRSNQNVIK